MKCRTGICGGLELWIRNRGVQDSYPESQQEDINDRIVHIQQKFKSLFETQLQEIQEVLQSAEGEPGRRNVTEATSAMGQKWSPINAHYVNQGKGKGWMPSVYPNVRQEWVPFESPNTNCPFRREFKICGQINEQGKGDQFSFLFLSREIEGTPAAFQPYMEDILRDCVTR